MKLNHIIGDLLNTVTTRPNTLIVHCVNNEYKFGSGIAGAIMKKWPHVREAYMSRAEWSMGDVQYVKISNNMCVANLCGQRGIGNFYETNPVRYEALQDGFIFIREALKSKNNLSTTSINIGRIGCGRAKGDYWKVEALIKEVFKNTDAEINIHTLESEMDQYCWPVFWEEYDPKEEKKCKCGHIYYRHFDWADEYSPGCKYCDSEACPKFERAI